MISSVLIYAVKSAFALTLLYVPYYFLLSKDSFFRFNRKILLSILVLSLVLPLCNASKLSFDENRAVKEVQEQMIEVGVPIVQYKQPTMPKDISYAEVEEQPIVVETSSDSHWFAYVSLLYIVGIMCVLMFRILQFVQMYVAVRKGCLWVRKDGKCKLYCHSENISPCSWMNEIVLSESDYLNGGEEIILHEKGHVVNHHSIDLILLTLVQMLQWWNPVIYLLGLSLRDVHEYEADDYALNSGAVAKKYQTLLIMKAAGSSSYAFANNFNESLTKKRITMMLKRKSNPWMMGKALIIVPMVFVALGAFATPEFIAPIEEVVAEIGNESVIPENLKSRISNISPVSGNEKVENSVKEVADVPKKVKTLADGEILILLDDKVVTVEEITAMEEKPFVVDTYVDELAWQTLVDIGSKLDEGSSGWYLTNLKDNAKAYGKYGATEKNGVLCLYSVNTFEASKLMHKGDSLEAMQALDKFLSGKSDNVTKAKCIYYVAEAALSHRHYTLAENLCKKALTYNEHYGRPLALMANIIYGTAQRAGRGVTAAQLYWNLGLYCCLAIDKAEEAIRIDPSCNGYVNLITRKCSLYLFPKSQLEQSEEYKNYKEGDEIEVRGEKAKLRLR